MFPNWLSIILLVLTFTSFIPQFHLLRTRKDASGISLAYILLNLIAASEQFALNFGFLVLAKPEDGVFVHHPITVGDWLNLSQTTLLWVLFIIYFTLCLTYHSSATSAHKCLLLGIYITYFLIAILPLFIYAIVLRSSRTESSDREWLLVLTFIPHTLILNYIGAIATALAVYAQAKEISQHDPASVSTSTLPAEPSTLPALHESLSLLTLAFQSILFTILGISWIFRVSFPPLPDGAGWRNYYILKIWYEWVGSIAVDSVIFGIGQGILLYLSLRRCRGEQGGDGERQPLLGSAR
ncbi:hypothetical protein BDW67DRAFT_168631 [Aspergillus spinulosporus]